MRVPKSSGSKKKCASCYGFGIWAIGDPVPMGPMDCADGCPTKPCPECGVNPNPVE
jgi:hypothetical protein